MKAKLVTARTALAVLCCVTMGCAGAAVQRPLPLSSPAQWQSHQDSGALTTLFQADTAWLTWLGVSCLIAVIGLTIVKRFVPLPVNGGLTTLLIGVGLGALALRYFLAAAEPFVGPLLWSAIGALVGGLIGYLSANFCHHNDDAGRGPAFITAGQVGLRSAFRAPGYDASGVRGGQPQAPKRPRSTGRGR